MLPVILSVMYLSQSNVMAQPSAKEIVEKSKAAMESAMMYQVSAGDKTVKQVVYQKNLTNGVTVSRSEISSGNVKIIYLCSDIGNYELFPDANAATDLSFQEKMGQLSSVNPFVKADIGTASWNGITTYNGQTCYNIEVHLLPPSASLMAILQEKAKLMPDACRYLIETNTYHVVQMTMLNGKSTFDNVEFKGFDVLPELPQDFFIVPANYKIEKPSSWSESIKIKQKNIALNTAPKKIPKGFAFDPETHRIVKVDPVTGAFSSITNKSSISARPPFGVLNENKNVRVVVLSILVISSVVFFSVIIRNKYRRK